MQGGTWGRQKPPVGSQINWEHPMSRGLIGCFLLNENAGVLARNLVNNTFGTLTNMFSSTSGWCPGSPYSNGSSLRFDGSDRYVSCGASLGSVGNIQFAVSCRFYTTSPNTTQMLVTRDVDTSREWRLTIGDGSSGKIVFIYGSGTVIGAVSLVANTWYHVFAWYDSSAATINVSVNGAPPTSASYALGTTAGAADFRIGGRAYPSFHNPLLGVIENAFVWTGRNGTLLLPNAYSSPYAMIQPPPATKFYSYAATVSTGNRRRRILCAGSIA